MLAVDIDAVLPYLNARLERAEYDHQTQTLIWKDRGRSFAFRSSEIKAAPALDRAEARQLIEAAIAMVNQFWQEREPRCDRRPRPNLMQLFQLLPRSNCGQCGCATCMAFSAGLLEGNKQLTDCPDLTPGAQSRNRSSLQELLGLPVD